MATVELNVIKQQSRNLLPKQKLELIKYLSESLTKEPNRQTLALLKFGKYSKTGLKPSSEEDFKIAEWHPTETELNGD
ncbi:MAG: hypothetical protein WBD27_02890 [Pyrinomonadaceae bacterium]